LVHDYPYVVVRFMAAVYGRRAVVFRGETPPTTRSRPVLVNHARPTTTDYPARLKRYIARLVLADVKSSGLRMCCVFAPNDCLYVEPDGAINPGNEAPSGGIALDHVEYVGCRCRKRGRR
jgi:hypothetical protein